MSFRTFKLRIFLCLLFLQSSQLFSAAIKPTNYDYGFGLGVGRPSGLSAYANLNDDNFLQGMLAFSSFGIVLTTDYAFRVMSLVKKHPQLVPYFGVGGLLYFFKADVAPIGSSDAAFTALGLRVPLGMYYQVKDVPLHFGLEAAPTAILSPGTWIFLDLTIFGRYLL